MYTRMYMYMYMCIYVHVYTKVYILHFLYAVGIYERVTEVCS